MGLVCWRICKEGAQQWSWRFSITYLWASMCWQSNPAHVMCQGHARMKCIYTRIQPSEGLPEQLCQGLVTHTIYVFIFLCVYVCKLQCLGWTSQLPSAVHSVKHLTVQEPEQPCMLQKSHSSRDISRGTACADPGNRGNLHSHTRIRGLVAAFLSIFTIWPIVFLQLSWHRHCIMLPMAESTLRFRGFSTSFAFFITSIDIVY